jgi:DNA-binding response OmpR family regulator
VNNGVARRGPAGLCLIVSEGRQELTTFQVALKSLGFAVYVRPLDLQVTGLINQLEPELLVVALSYRDSRDFLVLKKLAELAPNDVLAVCGRRDWSAFGQALNSGADACLADDAEMDLIVAQVRALTRRRGAVARTDGLVQIGDLVVDLNRCEIRRASVPVALTRSEFRIVSHLAKHRGRVLSPVQIMNAVTDYEYSDADALEVLKVYVRRIRKKLEPDPAQPVYLINSRGFGYLLEGGEGRDSAREGGHLRVSSA